MPSKRVKNRVIGAAVAVIAVPLLFGIEILMALPGPDMHFHNPTLQPHRFGTGSPPLRYLVMGDSTAAGEGASSPEHGIAYLTAAFLAQTHAVTMINIAVSGAKLSDVEQTQVPEALKQRPDIILLAVGANDVTHFTPNRKIKAELTSILQSLQTIRPKPQIVLTGSPAVGTVRRFAQPLRWLAGVETDRVNRVMKPICSKYGAIWAPIARNTGPLFARDPALLAIDRFHPNDAGYATWQPTLDNALQTALSLEAPQDTSHP